jgi:CelD/BcsL family acetyltransferase involved in cellulose biosynthesis
VSTTIVDPVTDPRWQRLVTSRPTTLFHSPEWLGVIAATYDLPVRAAVALDDAGQSFAGLPYVTVQDFMDRRTVSVPFSDFCDPLVGDLTQWRTLIDGLLEDPHRMDLRCLHNKIPLDDDRFAVVDRALWHAVDVRRDEEVAWTALPSSARRALRRARKAGVEVRTATDESDLRAFHALHVGVRKHKYGLLAQPYSFMEHIWEAFVEDDNGALLLATIDEQIVAGVMFLEWQGILYYKFNASDAAHLDLRPNDLLLWEGMRHARKRGLSQLDFGLTDGDQDGLIRYKRKYASQEKTVHLLRHEPHGLPTPADQMARQTLRDVTRLLTDARVPDDVTGEAGAALYRYFI